MFSKEPEILGSVMSCTVVAFKFFEDKKESSVTMAEQMSQMLNKNFALTFTVSVQSEAREGHPASETIVFQAYRPKTVNKTGVKAVQGGGPFKPQLWTEGWGGDDSAHLESAGKRFRSAFLLES